MSGRTRGTILKRRRRISFIALLLLVITASVFSTSHRISVIHDGGVEYIPLDELIAGTGLDHTFDMVAQKGKLYRKNHYAVYGVGLSAALVDDSLYKSPAMVCRRGGRILIPVDSGIHIMRQLLPGVRLVRKGDTITLEERPNDETTPSRDTERDRRGPGDRITFIIIDPGHGGKDPGAVGKGGLKEKAITLRVAQHLAGMFKKKLPEVRVYMTRTGDRFVELSGRTEMANRKLKKNENGIFISIHVNSSLSGRISGYETYFLSQNPTNEEARNTAALENNVIILEEKTKGKKGRDDVDFIEAMMITTQIQKESSALAASIQDGMAKNNRKFASRGVKKADFFVLRGALMPAALVEIGYISNKKESQNLIKDDHRETIARGIFDGVELFIKKYNSLIKVN